MFELLFSGVDQSVKGGVAILAAPDFEPLPKLDRLKKKKAHHLSGLSTAFCCIFVRLSACQRAGALWLSHGSESEELGSAPHMCASAARALCTWLVNWNQHEMIVGERWHARTRTRASFPSPSAHKRQRTIRPLINARESLVQVLHRLYVDCLCGSTVLIMVLIRIQGRNYSKTGECFL